MDDALRAAIAAELDVEPRELVAERSLAQFERWDSLTKLSVMVILGDALGKPIEHVAVTEDAMRESLVRSGMPLPVATGLAGLQVAISKGLAATVSPDVERVTGKKPARFATWVAQNVAAFR